MAGTSGNRDFDYFVRTRFRVRDGKVVILPDPMGGQFSTGMTPEQAEFLAGYLSDLAGEARHNRAAKYPTLYPEDAPCDSAS